ncbi:MAG: SPFH domain-containing protein [Pseudomonadota bacterium]
MTIFSGFVITLLVLAFFIVATAVKIVRQGQEYTLERFGKYTRTLEPGLHLIVPFFERVGHKMTMMEQVEEVPSQDVITKDNAVVQVDGVVYYQVLDASKAAYEVSKLEKSIINLVMTNIRTVMGSMTLDELLSHRDQINTRLLTVVDEATSPWGVKITRIEIKDIAPPRDLVDSMAKQMKAEREKRASVLNAEAERESKILIAEGLRQAEVLQAEGRREAAFRDAEARERQAEAEALATKVVSKAISQGDRQALNYFIAQKYVESLKDMALSPNQKTVYLPLEASGIISSIGGIAELAKNAVGQGSGAETKP